MQGLAHNTTLKVVQFLHFPLTEAVPVTSVTSSGESQRCQLHLRKARQTGKQSEFQLQSTQHCSTPSMYDSGVGQKPRCSTCIDVYFLKKLLCLLFIKIHHIFTLRFSDDLCSSPVQLCSVSLPCADYSSVPLRPSFAPLEATLEWQKSGTGMWSSCVALESCKKL